MRASRTAVAVLLTAVMTTLSIQAAQSSNAVAPAVAPASALVRTPTAGAAAPAATAAVCNKYCDARDPGLSTQDRVPVTATLFGRSFALHFDDADAMGWATIANGSPTDEVWVERSFDAGVTWDSGRLGDTTIPSGQTGWRTQMYNVDNWASYGVGALRACGKAGDRSDVVCTPLARTTWNAGERRTAAATALMQYYDYATGRFDTTGWWNTANGLNAIIDNIRLTGMGSYQYAIGRTYDQNINFTSTADNHIGQFRDKYIDDNGWWGLTWLAAYDLTGDSRYLTVAKGLADYDYQYWDTTCGGGVYWNTDKTVKNAISNSLFIQLNAGLHNRIPGDTTYLARANADWAWFKTTGMINSSNLVNDGVNSSTCRNDGGTVWSYNQGSLIGALTELYRATNDASLLTTAQQLGTAFTTSSSLNTSAGILRDPCESTDCGADGTTFKGAGVRGLAKLNAALSSHPYTTYLRHNADTAYAADRNTDDQYGQRWYGPIDAPTAAKQQSALDLMNAAS